jgi:hypothetical protein
VDKFGPTITAFVVAPIYPAFAFTLIAPDAGLRLSSNPESMFLIPTFFYVVSEAAFLIFGIPLFLIFNKLNLISWWSALLVGTVVGATIYFPIAAPTLFSIKIHLIFAFLGGTSTWLFWVIWRLGDAQQFAAKDV